ncbi:MAG TPA: hypothetical protein VH165_16995 [Kofleriaceae bacterium]|jgi:opacity protein-like surface antigen|nr:hypothetical protein [Kofleriaceae bacterium]
MSRCGLSFRLAFRQASRLVVIGSSVALPVVAHAQPSGPADRAPPAAASPAAPSQPWPSQPGPTIDLSPAAPEHIDEQPQVRVDLGVGFARRQLTYDTQPDLRQLPPSVTSGGASIQFDGELYPFAIADPHSSWKDVGLALTYNKTLGTSLKAANQTDDMALSVDQSYLSFGARYRFVFDSTSSVSVGLDYVHQQYILGDGSFVIPYDVPGVEYSAIAPTVSGRFAVAPGTMLVASLNAWFAFDAGEITNLDSYGQARVYGLNAVAGTEFALTDRVNLNILFQYNRVDLSFAGYGMLSNDRDGDPSTQDVNGATDESIGVVATLGMTY